MTKHKIAIWVENGMVQGVRSSVDISVEIIGAAEGCAYTDSGPDWESGYWRDANARRAKWDGYQTELPFSIF